MSPYFGLVTVETKEIFYPVFCKYGEALEKYMQIGFP